jgi:AraC-like DNA-binding protein
MIPMSTVEQTLLPTYSISQEIVRLSAKRPVRAQLLRSVGEVAPHDHDFYEICLVDGGTALHRAPNTSSTLTTDSIIVVPPGGIHAFTRCRQLAVTNLYYLSEWLLADARALIGQDGVLPLFMAVGMFGARNWGGVSVWKLDRLTASACRRELREIEAEGARTTPSTALLRAALVKFLVRLGRSFVAITPGELTAALPTDLAQALDHIEAIAGSGEPLRVRDLATNAGIGPDAFTRRFTARCGDTPMAYFQRRRIHNACAQLLHPGASVTSVALALGFADAAHLSRQFRAVMELTPSEYRKRYAVG